MDLHALGAYTQRACLQASQGSDPPDRRAGLPRWPVPLQLQHSVGSVASLGGAAVRTTARPGTLPCEVTLVLALPSEPGCLFGCVAFGRAGHGDITFRRTNATVGFPYGKGRSSCPRGARTSSRLRRRGSEGRGVPL